MFITKLRVLRSHGRQFIPDLESVELTERFTGRPVVGEPIDGLLAASCVEMCPTGALAYTDKLSLDLGRCIFCGECAKMAPKSIKFTNDFHLATNIRENLILTSDNQDSILFDADAVRAEIKRCFGRALKLRSVCAGGDNSTEMELGASMNVNFDFSRYGIDFVASPRHADGVVITGAITANMARPLSICYDAIADPKIIILAGTDAISGGLLAGSRAVDRTFLEEQKVDLYIPGNPVHPLAFIDGVLTLVARRCRK